MSKAKYAFIINSETYTPENYSTTIESESFITTVLGVNSYDMAIELSQALAENDFNYIDLCGDFGEEIAKKIQLTVGPNVQVMREHFSEDQAKKFTDDFVCEEYGVLVMAPGYVFGKHKDKIVGNEFNTTIYCVENFDEACNALSAMEAEGVEFTGLCSAFTSEDADELVKRTSSKIIIEHCTEA